MSVNDLTNDLLQIRVNGVPWDIADTYAREKLNTKLDLPNTDGVAGQVIAKDDTGQIIWKTLTPSEGGTYTAGDGISISDDNVISSSLTAGSGIAISDTGEITCTITVSDDGSIIYQQGYGISIQGTTIGIDERVVATHTTVKTEVETAVETSVNALDTKIAKDISRIDTALSQIDYNTLVNTPLFTDKAGNLFTEIPADSVIVSEASDELCNGVYAPDAVRTGVHIANTVWTLGYTRTRVIVYNPDYSRWELWAADPTSPTAGINGIKYSSLLYYAYIADIVPHPGTVSGWIDARDPGGEEAGSRHVLSIRRSTYTDRPQWLVGGAFDSYHSLTNKPVFFADSPLSIKKTIPGLITLTGTATTDPLSVGTYHMEDILAVGTDRAWTHVETSENGTVVAGRRLYYDPSSNLNPNGQGCWVIKNIDATYTGVIYYCTATDLFSGTFITDDESYGDPPKISHTSTWMQDTYTLSMSSVLLDHNLLANKPLVNTSDSLDGLLINKVEAGTLDVYGATDTHSNGAYTLVDFAKKGIERVWAKDGRRLYYNKLESRWVIDDDTDTSAYYYYSSNTSDDPWNTVFSSALEGLGTAPTVRLEPNGMQDLYTVDVNYNVIAKKADIKTYKAGRGISIAADGTISFTGSLTPDTGGSEEPENPETGEVIYGIIPSALANKYNLTALSGLTAAVVEEGLADNGTLKQETLTIINKKSLGIASLGDFVVVLVPAGYTADKFDGINASVDFQLVTGGNTTGANGDYTIAINDIVYYVYGELILLSTEVYIYVSNL